MRQVSLLPQSQPLNVSITAVSAWSSGVQLFEVGAYAFKYFKTIGSISLQSPLVLTRTLTAHAPSPSFPPVPLHAVFSQ